MTTGHLHGIVGQGSSGSYVPYDSPTVDIAPNSSGNYVVTYTYLTFFAGQNAYSCFVNGIEPLPGAGWQLDSCTWIPDSTDAMPHDCVNGTCVLSSVYITQGLYTSLSECQLACGSRGCSGQCVSSADWARIEGLVDQLKHRSCG